MSDRLTEIDPKDLPRLRELYKPSTSRRYITFVVIDTYIKWLHQDPHLKYLKFYCLNDDFSNGTFVVLDRATAYADTFHESTKELHRLLSVIDYSKGYLFLHIREHVADIVKQIFKQRNIDILYDDCHSTYYLSKNKGLEFNIQPPDGIELMPVTKRSDIEKVFSVWGGAAGGRRSLQFLLRQAKYNPSVGAFTKDGTMVARVFRFPTGTLLALQTDKNQFGRGYGSLVTKAISKQIAEMGYDIYAGVSDTNVASKALFGKLGFKPIDKMYTIGSKLNWPDVDD